MNKIPTDISELSLDLLRLYAKVITDNRFWRTFGFDSRPRRGRLFDFLISKKKLALESFVLTETFGMAFNDLKDALVDVRHFDNEEADFRALILVGLVCNAYQMKLFDSVDEILDTIIETSKYSKSKTKIVSAIIDRLQVKTGLSSSKTANIFVNLHLAFGTIKEHEGIILNIQSIRHKLEFIEPIGLIKSNGLDKRQTDKIAQVTYDLINN